MLSFYLVAGGALLTVAFIVLLTAPARWLGLVDHPDARKQHDRAMPIHGGFCIALVVLLCGGYEYGTSRLSDSEWVLLSGTALFAFIGVLDDLANLSARLRLVIEVGLLWVLFEMYGFRITALGDLWGFGPVELQLLSIPFTLFTIFCLLNGINMLDGMDGLAGGIAGIALAGFLAAAILSGVDPVGLLWVVMGALLGFLLLNARLPWRSRATVFMGDAGSLVLGFVLCWCCIAFTQQGIDGGSPVLRPITAVWIMALPVIDTVYVVIHRLRAGVGIFTPGRDHIHHRLQQLGMSYNTTVWLLWGCSALFAMLGLITDRQEVPEALMCYGFIGLAVVYYFLASRMPAGEARQVTR